MDAEKLKAAIRDIPDFPKEGIIFKDITTFLKDGEIFQQYIDYLALRYKNEAPDYIVGIEARGFIFGAALAVKLGCGFIPVRKKGKLPYKTIEASYSLEYGTAEIEMHEDAVEKGKKVVLIDDLLATGGTAAAAAGLLEKLGAELLGIEFLIELTFLDGRKKMEGYPVNAVILVD